jgi:hypothetical protein
MAANHHTFRWNVPRLICFSTSQTSRWDEENSIVSCKDTWLAETGQLRFLRSMGTPGANVRAMLRLNFMDELQPVGNGLI